MGCTPLCVRSHVVPEMVLVKGLKRIMTLSHKLITPVYMGVKTGGNREAYAVGGLLVVALKLTQVAPAVMVGVVALIGIGVVIDTIRYLSRGLKPKVEEIKNTVQGMLKVGQMMSSMFGK